MKILYISRYSNLMASSRYRVYGWANRIAGMGHSVQILFQRKNVSRKVTFWQKLKLLIRIMYYSMGTQVIVFHKYFPPLIIQRLLRSKRIIFDFDDRIFTGDTLRDSSSRFVSLLHIADGIILSVESMKQEILSYFPGMSDKMVVIPTLMDVEHTREEILIGKQRSEKSSIKIGWIGSKGGFQYLNLVEEPVSRILKEFSGRVEFFVVSDRPFSPTSNAFPLKNILWKLEKEHQYFLDMDITIMPLDSSERARAKAGFKILQSMVAGVPVVASAIGFNREIIQHGENGFLAETQDDFYRFLKKLILDESLRIRFRENGLETVKQFDYSQWKELYFRHILG